MHGVGFKEVSKDFADRFFLPRGRLEREAFHKPGDAPLIRIYLECTLLFVPFTLDAARDLYEKHLFECKTLTRRLRVLFRFRLMYPHHR